MNDMIKVALVDDHVLLRNGLAGLISTLGFFVHFECDNGKDLISKLDKEDLPDVILMDINMPEMDGHETTFWLQKNFPQVRVLALSMYDKEIAIIRMLKNGAKGYILKDTNPAVLKSAINTVMKTGFYFSDIVTGRMVHNAMKMEEIENKELMSLNEREIEFLKLTGTEMTYKEMADHMGLSPRTIDGYRDALFQKLNVKSRTGLVLFAIKHSIIEV
jgi:DNA-binding NarL/FixJ family response regulator